MPKTVLLYSGSFNPPHTAHFDVIAYTFRFLSQYLELDKIWMMLGSSPNKNPADYASLEHRKNMCEILAQDYPNLPLVIRTDIEQTTGTNRISRILKYLKEAHTDHKFVWVTGADNLINFHAWENSHYILEHFVTIVVARTSYSQNAFNSRTALDHAHRIIKTGDLKNADSGLYFFYRPSRYRHEFYRFIDPASQGRDRV